MIASLPMYQRPQLVPAHDRYWASVRSQLQMSGMDSPAELSQSADEFATWTDPGLVLSQTCGMPYRNTLHGRVTLVGTPDFGLDGCRPGWGYSVFVARHDDTRSVVADFADATFAWNQNHSQSGYSSAYHHVTALGFWFQHRHHSGQHLASAIAVAQGQADIAAIDAVTFRLIREHEDFADQLRVIDQSEPVPWLPYITAAETPAEPIFDAVSTAIEALSPEDRTALGIHGLAAIPAEHYLAVPNPPAPITATL